MTEEKSIEVSVICITYNQKEYIIDAIESILSQKTDFKYEIIVHDDASNDGTQDIIRSYMEEYPSLIRGIFEKENQYSKGIDFFYPLVTDVAKGKYVALCEADDYWIDDKKLQRQWKALATHPECDMCSCRGVTVTEDGKSEVSDIRPANGDCILSAEQVILGGGQYLVTAGLFFRRDLFAKKMNFEGLASLDYAHQIKGALRGGIYYIDRKMAVYRRYANGSWTNQVLRNEGRLRAQWDTEIALLKQLDIDTDGKYHDVIQERLKAYTPFSAQLEEHSDEIEAIFKSCKAPVFIWGMGRRGTALEAYCKGHDFHIDGICDAVNENLNDRTSYNNTIVRTNEVLKRAKTILASNRFAYEDLWENGYQGILVDCQKYMPYG